jgi:uncharacterized circularly permuted ATP-grasp superfamily protein
MKTIRGLTRVDVIYRRVDDEFLDPIAFRPDSLLGVPGLMAAYRAGNVALANAIGNGIADDKAIYAYVPEIIKYYLGEEPVLRNVAPPVLRPSDLTYVLEHLDQLVVKAVGESGGYGMLRAPGRHHAIDEFRVRVRRPRNHRLAGGAALRVPSYDPANGRIVGRHVDLRPCFVRRRQGHHHREGSPRALKPESMVVNSSQGGGSKDTWVLRGDLCSRESPNRCSGWVLHGAGGRDGAALDVHFHTLPEQSQQIPAALGFVIRRAASTSGSSSSMAATPQTVFEFRFPRTIPIRSSGASPG